jgi:hypothetical protein
MASFPPLVPLTVAGTFSRLIQPRVSPQMIVALQARYYPLSLLPYISLCIFVLCVVEAKLNRSEGGVKIITN